MPIDIENVVKEKQRATPRSGTTIGIESYAVINKNGDNQVYLELVVELSDSHTMQLYYQMNEDAVIIPSEEMIKTLLRNHKN